MTAVVADFTQDALRVLRPAKAVVYAEIVLDDNPSAYYRMDELAGSTAVDDIGTADGTYFNTPTLASASPVAGGVAAVAFSHPSSEYVQFPVVVPASAFTIELWVRITTTGLRGVLMRDATSSGGWIVGFDNAGMFAIRIGGTTINTSMSSVTFYDTVATRHIVVTRSGTTARVYIDGIEVGSGTVNGTVQNATYWRVGRNGTANDYMTMTVDEVAFYPAALVADRVTAHYAAGA